MRRLAAAAALSALLLTGCANSTTPQPVASASSTAGQALLARYGLDNKTTVEIIDRLDRLGGTDRPADLKASVRRDALIVTGGTQEFSLAIPNDRFYLSVAPYVDKTHECFYHSLTTCKGELGGKDIQVTIVDKTHDRVLVDEQRTVFANGFTGFWLPRDIKGTLRVSSGGKVAETAFTTDKDAPTCLTTLRLS
ncbi:CueP family metal-binding protein [Actinoplanes sp. NPDC049599]|uniref:CueP family metal-binding protein n=1 Tax=Actinoplanes sp. NPDC049599 TaxID=3363903 RepID=UPI0037BA4021